MKVKFIAFGLILGLFGEVFALNMSSEEKGEEKTIQSSASISAEVPVYNLNLIINPEGSGSVTKEPDLVEYDSSTVVGLTANPETGWIFTGWGEDLSGSDNPTSITMNSNKYVVAKFGHSLEIGVSPEGVGTVTRNPDKTYYAHNEIVQLTANPPEGYGFKRWDGTINGDQNPVSVTMDSNKEIIAVFDVLVDLNMGVYPVGGGTTVPEIGNHIYVKGEEVEISAVPTEGYEFIKWEGGVTESNNPNTTVIMSENKDVTAFFEPVIEEVTLTLQVDPTEGGWTDPIPGPHTYQVGEVVSITALPEGEMWEFVGWTGSVDDHNNPNTTITMNENKIVTANFEHVGYVIWPWVDPEGGGTIVADPAKDFYQPGEVVQLTASPSEGYSFNHWGGAIDSSENPVSIIMDSNKEIDAYFTSSDLVTLTLKVSPKEGGWTNPDPETYTYELGEVVSITAIPEGEAWEFVGWTGSVDDHNNPNTTITMNENKIVTANFERVGYFLETWVHPEGSGTIGVDPAKDFYQHGEVVQLTANPAEGYGFIRWDGAINGDENTVSIIMDSNKEIVAVFDVLVNLTMKVDPEGTGTTIPVPGNYNYVKNAVVEITAIPAEGYRFVMWKCWVADPYDPHTTVKMYDNETVTANFAPIDEDIILTMQIYPENGGTTEPKPGEHFYEIGDTVNISAIPVEGYKFVKWMCDVADPYNPNTTVIMNCSETVTAKFEPIRVKLTMRVNPENGGETDPGVGKHYYDIGKVVNIFAEPLAGYSFTGWTGDVADPESPRTTVTMNEYKTVTANFEHVGYFLETWVHPEGGGTIAVDPAKDFYQHGELVQLTANPAEGYSFSHWDGAIYGNENPVNVTMDSSKKIIAVFIVQADIVVLNMNVYPKEGGTTIPEIGTHSYVKGEMVEITANPSEGYQFIRWECHDFNPRNPDTEQEPYSPNTITDPYNPHTVVYMDTSKSVIALFEQTDRVHLIMEIHPPEGGRTEPEPGMYNYEKSDTVAISAIPSEGYRFIKWECHAFDPHNPNLKSEPYNLTDSNDSRTIADPFNPNTVVYMDTSQTVIALFEQTDRVHLIMEIHPPEGGRTEPEPGMYTHEKGDSVAIFAVPAEGYRFVKWECHAFVPHNPNPKPEPYNLTDSYDSRTIADPFNPKTVVYMDTSQTVIAIFEQTGRVQLIMESHPPEGGRTEPEPGMYTHEKGDSVAIFAFPAEGYCFVKWECHAFDPYNPFTKPEPYNPGTIADPYNPNTVVYMDTSQTVIAIFEQTGRVHLFMDTHPPEGGRTEPEPGMYTHEKGDTVTISAFPAEGYRFVKWECHTFDPRNPGQEERPYNPNTIADPYSPNTVVYMDTSQAVIALFEHINGVKLIIGVFPPEGGKTEPEPGRYNYAKGDTVSISAIPEEGYRFIKWECHIIDPYNTNPGDKLHGLSKAIESYDPNTIDDPYSPRTVVYMDTSQAVIAVFETVGLVNLIMEFYPPDGGKTEPEPGKYTHEKGDKVAISAIPAKDYQFVKWECYVFDPYSPDPFDDLYDFNPFDNPDNLSSTDNLYNPNTIADPYNPNTVVYMDTTQIVIALFKPINGANLIMVAYPPNGGKTEPEPGMYNYEKGDSVSISAIPAEGYQFIRWECKVVDLLHNPDPFDNLYDPNTIADPYSPNTVVYVDTAQAVIAIFEAVNGVNLTIEVYPPKVGTTEPEPGTYTYRKGEIVILEAIPKEKLYHFAFWEGDVIDPHRARTMVKMNTTKTVTAHFEFGDNVPPHMFNCFPRPGSTEIPKNTNIKFNIGDLGFGVDLMTLDTWVNDLKIIDKGLDQTGGRVSIKSNSHSYHVLYNTDKDFQEGITVTVNASCYDLASPANYCDSSYSFTIGKAKIDTSAKKVLGETGGTVSDTTSGVELNVPANALIDSVEISINTVEDPPPLPDGVTGIASTLHFGPDGLQFNEPVRIQIPYTQADLENANITSPEDLRIFYFHTSTGEWIELTIDSVDVVNMIIYVVVYEFCYFSFGYEEETSVSEQTMYESTKPAVFALSQNYPNPFNPETHIQFQIPEQCQLVLAVYNSKGELIRTLVHGIKTAGLYEVVWDGKDDYGNQVSTGLYIFKMQVQDQIFIRKVTFIK